MIRETAAQIIADVASKAGITVEEIKGNCLEPRFVYPRHEACYKLRYNRGLSYPTIARLMHYDHHTGVMHAVRAHGARSVWVPNTNDDPLGFWPCLHPPHSDYWRTLEVADQLREEGGPYD